MFTITRNTIYDRYKKTKELPLPEGWDNFITAEKSSNVIDVKMQEDLKKLLKSLPEITREIIVLKIWEEYKFSRIAEIVGKSEEAVKKQFYRGLEVLREMLENNGYDKNYVTYPVILGNFRNVARSRKYQPADEYIKTEIYKLNKLSNPKTMRNIPKPMQWLIGVGATTAIAASIIVINYALNSDQTNDSVFTHSSNQVNVDNNTTTKPIQTLTPTSILTNTLTPAPDKYDGWNTYTNDIYNYTLRYPSDWTVTETDLQSCPQYSAGCFSIYVKGERVVVSKDGISTKLIIHFTESPVESYGTGCFDENDPSVTIQEFILVGQKAYLVYGSHGGIVYSQLTRKQNSTGWMLCQVPLSRNGKVYTIYSDMHWNSESEVFDSETFIKTAESIVFTE